MDVVKPAWVCKCRDLQAILGQQGIYECEKCYKKWVRMTNDEWREFYETDDEPNVDGVVPYSHCILRDSV